MSQSKRSDLLTQSEARAEARRISEEEGSITIATPVPYDSWGGEEDGWTVTTLLKKGGWPNVSAR